LSPFTSPSKPRSPAFPELLFWSVSKKFELSCSVSAVIELRSLT